VIGRDQATADRLLSTAPSLRAPEIGAEPGLTLSEKRFCRQSGDMWSFDSASCWQCLFGAGFFLGISHPHRNG
jgi:hypothetical protein